MEILVGSSGTQFETEHATRTKIDDRASALVDWPIAHNHQAGLEFFATVANKLRHMRTAHLLLAFQ